MSITRRRVISLTAIAAAIAAAVVAITALRGPAEGGEGDTHAAKVGDSRPQADSREAQDARGEDDDGEERDGGTEAKGDAPAPDRGSARPLSPREIRRALDEVPAEDLSDFARQAALNVLKSLGYPGASISVSDDAYAVLVSIPREYACGTKPSDAAKIERELKKIIIFASKVRVYVAQGGGPINAYVRNHCAPLEMPEADGPVVYSASGTGIRGSDEFRIKSPRWTVSFENGGPALEIYVSKGEKLLKPVIKSKNREVGSRTYEGPGRFRVTATGAGRWKVRVYDGA